MIATQKYGSVSQPNVERHSRLELVFYTKKEDLLKNKEVVLLLCLNVFVLSSFKVMSGFNFQNSNT